MTALYTLAAEYAALAAAVDDGADAGEALAAIGDSLEVKARNIGALLRNYDAEVTACKAEEERISARRKARENARDRLREYLRTNMEAAGMTRIAAPTFTLSLRASESVEVVDFDAVPAEYKRTKTTVEVAKADVLAAWRQNGEVVPGANVVSKTSLVVK